MTWNDLREWLSAIGSVVSATGVVLVYYQIRVGRRIALTQFEDAISREYRELSARLPAKAILGQKLTDEEHAKYLEILIHYFDLTNEQIFLRHQERVSRETWRSWSDGIQSNLSRPAYMRAWREVKAQTNAFIELRRLEREQFAIDPVDWKPDAQQSARRRFDSAKSATDTANAR